MQARTPGQRAQQTLELITEIDFTPESPSFWEQLSIRITRKKSVAKSSFSLVTINEHIKAINDAARPLSDRKMFAQYLVGIGNLSIELLRLRDETIILANTKKAVISFDETDDEKLQALASEFSYFQRLISLSATQLKNVGIKIEDALDAISKLIDADLSEHDKKQLENKKVQLSILQDEVIAAMQKYLQLLGQNEHFAKKGLLKYFFEQLDLLLAPTRPNIEYGAMHGNFNDFMEEIPLRLINGHLLDLPEDLSDQFSDLDYGFELLPPESEHKNFFSNYIKKIDKNRESTDVTRCEQATIDSPHIAQEEIESFDSFYQQFIQHEDLVSIFENQEASKIALKDICDMIDNKIHAVSAYTDEEKRFLRKGDEAGAVLTNPKKISSKGKEKKKEKEKEKEKETKNKYNNNGNRLFSELKRLETQGINETLAELSEDRRELEIYKLASSYASARKRYLTFIDEMDGLFAAIKKEHPELQNNILEIENQWERRRLFANMSCGAIQEANDGLELEFKRLEVFIGFVKKNKKPFSENEKQLLLRIEDRIQQQREKICDVMLERIMLCPREPFHDDVVFDTLQRLKDLGLDQYYPRYFENEKITYGPIVTFSMSEEQRFAFIWNIRQHGTKKQKQALSDCYNGKIPNKDGVTVYDSGMNNSYFLVDGSDSSSSIPMLSSSPFTSLGMTTEPAVSRMMESSFFMISSPASPVNKATKRITKEEYNNELNRAIDDYNQKNRKLNRNLKALFSLLVRNKSYNDISKINECNAYDIIKERCLNAENLILKIKSYYLTLQQKLDPQIEIEGFGDYFYDRILDYSDQEMSINKAALDTAIWCLTKDWNVPVEADEFRKFVIKSTEISSAMRLEDIVESVKERIALFKLRQELISWIQEEIIRIRSQNYFSTLFMSSEKTQAKLGALTAQLNNLDNIMEPKDMYAFMDQIEHNASILQSRNTMPFASSYSKTAEDWNQFKITNTTIIKKVAEDMRSSGSRRQNSK